MHRYGPDPHFLAGVKDAQGDFAAIGDQDFAELHGWRCKDGAGEIEGIRRDRGRQASRFIFSDSLES